MRVEGRDAPDVARVKGDARMGTVLSRAIDDRERPLRWDLVVPYGRSRLRMTREQSRSIVRSARRRFRGHNAGRRYVEQQVFAALAASTSRELEPGEVRAALRWTPEVREALEWMWPRLTPEHLLHDLFGSRALLRHAARDTFGEAAADSLHRPRSSHVVRGACGRSTTCRCSTRPTPTSARCGGGTRSARSATSSWTRPRTGRPWSCACWPGGPCRAR